MYIFGLVLIVIGTTVDKRVPHNQSRACLKGFLRSGLGAWPCLPSKVLDFFQDISYAIYISFHLITLAGLCLLWHGPKTHTPFSFYTRGTWMSK